MDILHSLLWCILIAVIGLPTSVYMKYAPDETDLFLDKYSVPTTKIPFDYINIDPKKVTIAKLSPLVIHGVQSDHVKVVNDGKSVKVEHDQPCIKSGITGGILGTDKYRFQSKKYFWAANPNGIAATTIDGKGFPLEDIGVLYNEKYGTFENAYQHEDGVVELHFTIGICPTANKLFESYAKILKQVHEPGLSAKTSLGNALSWFSSYIPVNTIYYTYMGSAVDEKTGKIYATRIIIISHLPGMCLSKEQYEETFGSFKNFKGKPINVAKRCLQTTIPVVKGTGIFNILTP